MNGGKLKMNPNYGDEKSTKTGTKMKVEKKQIIDFDTTDKDKKLKGPSAELQKAKMVGSLGSAVGQAIGALGGKK